MYNFTNNPFERMMKEKPSGRREPMPKPPPCSPCYGCSVWWGMACVGICCRTWNLMRKVEGANENPRTDPR